MTEPLPTVVAAHDLQIIVGERIRDFRKKSRMTQAKLADEVGISRAAVANIEVGRQRMSVVLLVRLAECFNAQIGDIIPSLRELTAFSKKRREITAATVAPSSKLAQELAKHNISMAPPVSINRALAEITHGTKKEKTP